MDKGKRDRDILIKGIQERANFANMAGFDYQDLEDYDNAWTRLGINQSDRVINERKPEYINNGLIDYDSSKKIKDSNLATNLVYHGDVPRNAGSEEMAPVIYETLTRIAKEDPQFLIDLKKKMMGK